MGVNICVQTLDGEDHPEWDWIRYAGDRDLATYLTSASCDRTENSLGDYVYRPRDIEHMERWIEKHLKPFGNEDRWRQLLRLLRENQDLWIYVSW